LIGRVESAKNRGMDWEDAPPITRSELAAALRQAGVRQGGVLMVHTRMSAIGWVVGGADTVVLALLDAVGQDGTLLAYTAWEHDAFHIAEWPEDRRAAYLRDPPVFDPTLSESMREVGRIPERIRTWPGARRSSHPLASVAALGRAADHLTRDHRLEDAYGPTSPLARLVERDGQVLLLGAPLETLTILHHAEAIANVPEKRMARFPARLRSDEGVADLELVTIDASRGAFDYGDYERQGMDGFEAVARAALAAGVGRTVQIGGAASHLFEARALVQFAVAWMERQFSPPT
jgi:aminoglycoside 3-N-acetyltransferase